MSTVMHEAPLVTIEQAKEIIRDRVIRRNKLASFWGPPGAAKSAIVKQVAQEMGYRLLVFRLSEYDSVDFRGYPGLTTAGEIAKRQKRKIKPTDAATQMATWHVFDALPFEDNPLFGDDEKVLVFLDEVNGGTTKAVFAVSMQLLLDRCVGNRKLKPNVRICCAGNRVGDRGVAVATPTTFNNRSAHFALDYDRDAFCAHMATQLPKDTAMMITAFLHFQPAKISTFDPKSEQKAFASYRTWEDALEVYSDPSIPEAHKRLEMAGTIGQGLTDAFFLFRQHWQLMASYMPQIKKDPEHAPLPTTPDAAYAVAVAVSGEMTTKSMDKLWLYLKRLDAAYIVCAIDLALARDPSLTGTDAFMEYARMFREVVRAA